MPELKKNVAVFDNDVRDNSGYRYTTNAAYSSIVANRRMTQATLRWLGNGVTSVVDVGCGDGTYTDLIQRARPGLRVTGFDPAVGAVSLARTRYPGLEFFVADILRPETCPQARFDLVIVRGVLHHLTDQAAAIRACARLGDRILIIEPNGNNPVLKIIEKVSPYHREHEEQSFGSAKLSRWCREAGLEVEGIEFIGFVPMFFPTFPAKVIHFVQPMLEKVPLLARFLGAQIVLVCRRREAKS